MCLLTVRACSLGVLLVTPPPCPEAPRKLRGRPMGEAPWPTLSDKFPTEPLDDPAIQAIPAPAGSLIRLPGDSGCLESRLTTCGMKNHPAHQRIVRWNQVLVFKATFCGSLLRSKRYSINVKKTQSSSHPLVWLFFEESISQNHSCMCEKAAVLQ